MIKVLLFAEYRERLDCDNFTVASESLSTVNDLVERLQERGDNWQAIFTEPRLLIAKNQTHCRLDSPLHDGDEIAFFPPVSGG